MRNDRGAIRKTKAPADSTAILQAILDALHALHSETRGVRRDLNHLEERITAEYRTVMDDTWKILKQLLTVQTNYPAEEIHRVLTMFENKILELFEKGLTALPGQIADRMVRSWDDRLKDLSKQILDGVAQGAYQAVQRVEGCNMSRQTRTEQFIRQVQLSLDQLDKKVSLKRMGYVEP